MNVLAPGFVAGGMHCGIKPDNKPDLAMIRHTDGKPLAAAGVFTSNKLTAAPVQISAKHLHANPAAVAVTINSGNANAATGKQGIKDALEMCQLTATQAGCATEDVLVCSTGLIGFPMPMQPLRSGIPKLFASCSSSETAAEEAAVAMMTTDTVPKMAVVEADGFKVGGIAKGAAMLQPNMQPNMAPNTVSDMLPGQGLGQGLPSATMLAVLTTDAKAQASNPGQPNLQQALNEAVASSFNTITIDGAESTNDTVLLLSSGLGSTPTQQSLSEAVSQVCYDLAHQMVDDAEGSTKTVELIVTGAATQNQAETVARRCANSQLIKCSWYGRDAYWGRIASECGASGVDFSPDTLTISYGDFIVYDKGAPQSQAGSVSQNKLADYMAGRQLQVRIDLGQGDCQTKLLTCDLTHAYIDENMGTS